MQDILHNTIKNSANSIIGSNNALAINSSNCGNTIHIENLVIQLTLTDNLFEKIYLEVRNYEQKLLEA